MQAATEISVTISQEARILLAHEALSFEPGDWNPESITRHLKTQSKLAHGHLQAIIDHNTCPLTDDLQRLQQQINQLLSATEAALVQLNQNNLETSIELLSQSAELCNQGER